MPSRIQIRRGTASQWTTANPLLSTGEPGYETDTKRRKIGDGSTLWNSLPYDIDTATANAAYRAVADSAAVINVAAQAGASADLQFQAAITAAVAQVASGGGATIVLPPGVSDWTSSVPSLPHLGNYSGWIRITGSSLGSTVKLSATGRRFMDFGRTADNQVFGQIEIDHIKFDCNGIDGHDAVILGTAINAIAQVRVSVRDVYVHDVEVVNAPTNANTSSQRHAIKIFSYHNTSDEATQTFLKDIRVERLRMRRNGSGGVAIGANGGGGGNSVNCLTDNITIKDCEATCFAAFTTSAMDVATIIANGVMTPLDDTSGFPSSGQVNIFSGGSTWNFTYTGKTATTLTGLVRTAGPTTGTIPITVPVGMPVTSCFGIGGVGKGGTYTVENLIGGYSGDNAFEFDAPTTLVARNLQSEVVGQLSCYLMNYNSAYRQSEQHILIDGLTHREPYKKSSVIAVRANTAGSNTMGTVELRNIRNFISDDDGYSSNTYGRLIVIGGAVSRVIVRGASIDWNATAIGTTPLSVVPAVDVNSTVACNVILEDVRMALTGALTIGANDPNPQMIQIRGTNTRFFINRPQMAVTITGLNAAGQRVTMIDVGSLGTGNNTYGEIRGARLLDITGQVNVRGVRIAATTTLTLSGTKRIKITDSDFTIGSSVVDLSLASPTNHGLYVDVVKPFISTSGRPASVSITPGASPYTFQTGASTSATALGMDGDVVVSGGTVSAIEISHNGSTWINTGLTAGSFPVPNGKYIKVTYSVAPTMTFYPTP